MSNKELRAKWEKRIQYILDKNINLNDWESDFIDSIQIHLARSESNILSWKQEKCLTKLFERAQNK